MSRQSFLRSLVSGIIGSAVAAGLFSACSVTTSPDDSAYAPHKGSHIFVRVYPLDTRTRQVAPNATFSEHRDTVSLDTTTYMGYSNVFQVTRSGSAYLGSGTLYMNYSQNGDVSIYRPTITGLRRTSIPGFWLRLPFGSKVGSAFRLSDTTHIVPLPNDSAETLVANWTITFEGPDTVTTRDLLAPEALNTVKLHLIEEVVSTYGSRTSLRKNDIIYDYAPSIGYFVKESGLMTAGAETSGYERVVESYDIVK